MPDKPRNIRDETLKRMLKPLVRYCVRGSDTIQHLFTLLKAVYVEVAVEELEQAGSKVNMSRINLMTGVHRADIAKIYKKNEPLKPFIGDIVRRVLGQWEHDEEFCTKDGKPRVLRYQGEDNDLERLLAKVSTSVGPKAVLFELERADVIEKTRAGIKLKQVSIRSTTGSVHEKRILASNMQALVNAAMENEESAEEEKPNLLIRTEYDNVFQDDLPRIRSWLRREGRKFHKRARDYISKYDKDIHDRPGRSAGGRVVLGAFSFIDEKERTAADS